MPTALRGHVWERRVGFTCHAKPWAWHPTLVSDVDGAECRTILLVIWDALWVQLSERESDRRSSYYA